MVENNQTSHTSQSYEIDDKKGKWYGQEVGVNSEVPLVDSGRGKPYIIRQFEFTFNPEALKKIREKKIPSPTKQELFNQHWRQIQLLLWGDGLKAYEGVDPRVILYKRKYKIILLCEPRLGTMIADKPQTLQELTKPSP